MTDGVRLAACTVSNKYEKYYGKSAERENSSWNLRLRILEEGRGAQGTRRLGSKIR